MHDPAGGFFENLDALGSAVTNQRRSTLVQARLTYVFSHAYMLSHDPAYREAARHGLAFLMRAARAPDGGWFRTVSVDGATLDNTRDAYDHAFVLFALAWYFRATGDVSAIQLADATWEFMQQPAGRPALWRLSRGDRAGPRGRKAAAPPEPAHASARSAARAACRDRREELAAPRRCARRSVQAPL